MQSTACLRPLCGVGEGGRTRSAPPRAISRSSCGHCPHPSTPHSTRPPPPPVTRRSLATTAKPATTPAGFDLLDALPPRPAAAPAAPFAPPRPLAVKAEQEVGKEAAAVPAVKAEAGRPAAHAHFSPAATPAPAPRPPDAGSTGAAPPTGGRLEAVLRGFLESGLITPGDEQLKGVRGVSAGAARPPPANPFAAGAAAPAPFALAASRSRAPVEDEGDAGLPAAAAALLAPRPPRQPAAAPAAAAPPPPQPSHQPPPPPSTTPSLPWWQLLPDFVPVSALRSGFDPRGGHAVAIDYAGQAAAWAMGGGGGGAYAGASGSGRRGGASAGFWTTAAGGRKTYTAADGRETTGRVAYAASLADKRGGGGGRGRGKGRRRKTKKRRKG